MMQVYIYDIDFLHNGSPNFLAMRVSSYHKQLGDTVTLMRPQDKLPKRLERIYIFRQDESLPKPQTSLLLNKAAYIYGIRYFDNWSPLDAQLACRPDYMLYPRGRDKFERADAVQLTNERGALLKVRQNYENTETNKDTVVTDEHLWITPTSELLQALDLLKDRKNIYFLRPISLSRMLTDQELKEKFIHLSFANGRKLQWSNSVPFIEEKVQEVFKFFDDFKALHPKVSIGEVDFSPKSQTRTDIENFKLCLKTIMGMKQRCWKLTIRKLDSRLDSVYSHYYELLRNWSIQPHLSFFEFIAQTPAKRLHMSLEEYYCHPELWIDEMFRAGIELYHYVQDWDLPQNWALWQYQDNYWNTSNINWTALLRKELWY